MAGSIFGLGLSQQFDANARPLSACKLFLYSAGTTTPATAYSDTGLVNALPWPVEADANGRIPAFWLADGSYRVRLTDRNGIVQFDEPSILALGASSGGGGGGDTTDPYAIFQTGDSLFLAVSGTRAGWVRDNGRTIGSASSGATERANLDCQALYEFLWNGYSDTLCPVTGGRGASAAADWSANKPIATLDFRGRMACGLDDMGNSAASRLSGVTFSTGNATTAASLAGAATNTILQENLPNVDLTAGSDGDHDHMTVRATNTTEGSGMANLSATNSIVVQGTFLSSTEFNYALRNDGTATRPTVGRTSQDGAHTHTVPLGGSGTAINNMPPIVLGTWYRRL